METGIDKQQIEAIKRFGKRLTSDPARLRATVCIVLAGVGLLGVERPLGQRLEAARTANAKAKAASKKAEEAVLYTKQRALYEERVAVDSEITNWQNYVLELLDESTAMLVSLEPRKASSRGPFSIVEMELVVKGSSYNEFTAFIGRLERGPRIVRLDKMRMERQQGSIYLTCIIKGLIKKSAKKPTPKQAAPDEPHGAEAATGAVSGGGDAEQVGPDSGADSGVSASDAEGMPADETTDAPADAPAGVPDEVPGSVTDDGMDDATESARDGAANEEVHEAAEELGADTAEDEAADGSVGGGGV